MDKHYFMTNVVITELFVVLLTKL